MQYLFWKSSTYIPLVLLLVLFSHVRTDAISVFVVINLQTTGTGIVCEFHFILEFCDPPVHGFSMQSEVHVTEFCFL